MKSSVLKKIEGGVLALTIFLLALSLTFTACSDGGDDNSNSDSNSTNSGGIQNGNGGSNSPNNTPSTNLPGTKGDTFIDEIFDGNSSGNNEETSKTITLSNNDDSDYILALNNDGTATLYNDSEPYSEFKYNYDSEKKEIYMSLEKCTSSYTKFGVTDNSLYTYNEQISQIKERTEKDDYIDSIQKQYNEYKDTEWFKEQYPDCKSYEDCLKITIAQSGYGTLDEMLSAQQEKTINNVSRLFNAQITFGYEIDTNKKMTLSEKFTGIKNLSSETKVSSENADGSYFTMFNCYLAIISKGENVYYSESINEDKIVFYNPKNWKDKITATYKEDLENKMVTVTINDENFNETYLCTFEGTNYTQEGGSSSSGDENNEPIPTLPGTKGDTFIDEIFGENSDKTSIRLKHSDNDTYPLVLNNDGTAITVDEDNSSNMEFTYTYDTSKKQIYIKLSKISVFSNEDDEKLYTYEESLSQINDYFTIENQRKILQTKFEEEKDTEDFKKDYPDCDTYAKYEKVITTGDFNFKSFDEYVIFFKTTTLSILKSDFRAVTTYDYKYKDGTLTLTEKFTGVKNLFYSNCEYEDDTSSAYVQCFFASCGNDSSVYTSYAIDTNTKKIEFFDYEDIYTKINGTYTEDLDNGIVTISVDGKDYPCEFKGSTYIQE